MDRLTIGIDGYNLAIPNGTGVATYGLTLAATLKAAGHGIEGVFGIDVGHDPALREVLFFDHFAHGEPAVKTDKRILRDRRRLFRESAWPWQTRRAVEVPLTARVERAAFAGRLPDFDRIVSSARLFQIAHRHFHVYKRFIRLRMENLPPIMHWTYPVPIELAGARNVYTLHDLVPLRLPYTTLDAKQGYRDLVGACVARAAHICTVSEASRADILAEFEIDPARVTNTYQASPLPADLPDPAEDAAAIEGLFGLRHRGYFLYFGAIEPKKNLGRLIEAHLSTQSDTPLVLVGGRGWRSEAELRLLPGTIEPERAHDRRVAERVIRLDHLARPLLLRLIRAARAVVFPSICEGFGLPVLEAMQLGTPVLTARAGALREVAGAAALLIDPYDVGAIAAGLRALDGDADLRARLAGEGLVQAGLFSAERYRRRIEAMYAGVLASGNGTKRS